MKPGRELDTLEDLVECLIAEAQTVALQELRQMMESKEFNLDGLIISLAKKKIVDDYCHCGHHLGAHLDLGRSTHEVDARALGSCSFPSCKCEGFEVAEKENEDGAR